MVRPSLLLKGSERKLVSGQLEAQRLRPFSICGEKGQDVQAQQGAILPCQKMATSMIRGLAYFQEPSWRITSTAEASESRLSMYGFDCTPRCAHPPTKQSSHSPTCFPPALRRGGSFPGVQQQGKYGEGANLQPWNAMRTWITRGRKGPLSRASWGCAWALGRLTNSWSTVPKSGSVPLPRPQAQPPAQVAQSRGSPSTDWSLKPRVMWVTYFRHS